MNITLVYSLETSLWLFVVLLHVSNIIQQEVVGIDRSEDTVQEWRTPVIAVVIGPGYCK